jgi:long-chain acyl-CoA synthetase
MPSSARWWTMRRRGSGARRGAGDAVGLCLPNTPFFVIGYFGALKAGGIVVNFNPLNVGEELAAQVRDSGCEIVLAPDLEPIFGRVMGLLGTTPVRRVVACRFARALPPVKAAAFRIVRSAPDLARVPVGDDRVVEFEALVSGPRIAAPPRSGRRRRRCCSTPAAPPARRRAWC